MKRLGYIGFLIGMAWGTYVVIRAAYAPASKVICEGQYIWIVMTLPLFLAGFIHTSIDGRFPSLPIVYATGITLLLMGETEVYHIHFREEGPHLGPSIVVTVGMFIMSTAVFSIVPLVRMLIRNLGKRIKPNQAIEAIGDPGSPQPHG